MYILKQSIISLQKKGVKQMQQKYRRSKMFESTAEPPPPSFPMSVQRPRPHLAIGLCSLPCKNVVKDVPFPQRNTAKDAKVEVKKR